MMDQVEGQVTEAVLAYLAKRGISAETATQYGIWGRKAGRGGDWICFPYLKDGAKVNTKFRKFRLEDDLEDPERLKEHLMEPKDSGAEIVLWNRDILDDPALEDPANPLVITEGEFDALSVIEAGHPWVVSVPNGASEGVGYLDEAMPKLRRVARYIIAADGDRGGAVLRQALIERLSLPRCFVPAYPEGVKDLNQVLLRQGKDGVLAALKGASPVPYQGTYYAWQFSDFEGFETFNSEIGFLDQYMRPFFPSLIVVTGVPSTGKSLFVHAILFQMAKLHGHKTVIGSFENRPPKVISRLRQMYAGRRGMLTEDEYVEAQTFINGHFYFITADAPRLAELDETPVVTDLDWFLNAASVFVLREGAKFVVLDPWNQIIHRRARGQDQAEYIEEALLEITRWANRLNICVIIVAHPTKIETDKKGEFRKLTLYDISGCYSADTEVLTRGGWKKHGEISESDQVACFEPHSETVVYANPTRVICKDHDGEMVSFQGSGYDLLVTPDHRMVVQPLWKDPTGSQAQNGLGRPVRWKKGSWAFCEADRLPNAVFVTPLAAPLAASAESTIGADMASLAGWYASEGCGIYSGVTISQAVGPKSDAIQALLERLNVPFSVYHSPPGGKGGVKPMKAFYLGARSARNVVRWLKAECGVRSRNKRIPSAILRGSAEEKRAFLEAYIEGDGHRISASTMSATTTSARLRDELQRLCLELGVACSWSERARSGSHRVCWQLNIGRGGRATTALRHRNMSRVYYLGKVYCLTVPTGAYVVRRHGKMLICGNSAAWYNKCDVGIVLHRPGATTSMEVSVAKIRYEETGTMGSTHLRWIEDWQKYMGGE